MKVKLILPALTEARSKYWISIKYSLFPPLGLATLAGFFEDDDIVTIVDEHVEGISLDDEPDLVAIQVYITSAYRSYQIADHYRSKGVYVVLGGLHVTSLPDEASSHADTIFLGPADYSWPRFIRDFRAGRPNKLYTPGVRTLDDLPQLRRDLIKRHLYLVPNSLVVSRGCPYHCDFCYKDSFFAGGSSFYTMDVDKALECISSLPGRHLFFLDDHLFGNRKFASELFSSMKGMSRIWQAAGTVNSVLDTKLFENAVKCGLKSLFIGFESLNQENLENYNKRHVLINKYQHAIKQLHEAGVMINASFVFGMDEDDESVFDRTVNWAIENGIETSTFHILTPYPGTRLYEKLFKQDRIVTNDWNFYDTRHVVFKPARMSATRLEEGYWRAYENFYSWRSIFRCASKKADMSEFLRHFLYTSAWKKCEHLWKLLINIKRLNSATPILETVLSGHKKSLLKKNSYVRTAVSEPLDLLAD